MKWIDVKADVATTFSGTNDRAGCDKFLSTRDISEPSLGYLKDGWIELIVQIDLQHHSEETRFSEQQRQTEADTHLCLQCNQHPQTAGYVHGRT